MGLSSEQERIKSRFIEERGFWGDFHDTVLALDPQLLDAYIDVSGVPWRKGHLTPKVKELLYLAMDASTTHLHLTGVRVHLRNAVAHGASRQEILEVLELVSEIGVHTMTIAVPIVLNEARVAGVETGSARASLVARIRDDFVRVHGYWETALDDVVEVTPEYVEAYVRYAAVARGRSHLDPAVRELILLGVSASATHLHPPAIRLHSRNALAAGASVEQLIETLEVVSVAGIHTITDVFPIVAEECAD